MGPVKGLCPALRPPMVCFNGFQQGTPLLVIIIVIMLHTSTAGPTPKTQTGTYHLLHSL
jgi:hypothetical protein